MSNRRNAAERLVAGMVLVLILGLTVSASTQVDARPGPRDYLVFGFLPIVSSERLVRRFSPLVDYLSVKLEREIRMETAPDFAEFLRRTRDEKRYDILFTAPHFYYLAKRGSGYRSVVRVNREGMKAVVVAPADSSIGSVQELRGRRLATTGPLALSTILVSDLLRRSGLDPGKNPVFIATPSHNATLLSSFRGTTDASALMLPVYRRARSEIIDTMKIIAETRSVPHIPIAVAPWVDERLASRIRTTLLQMGGDQEGHALLRRLDWPGFTATRDGEYDSLEWIAEQLGVD